MPREPQSYGSGSDWVTGRTDQKVNDQKSTPAPEHQEFYDERRESETSSPAQGGRTSDVQLAESAQPTGTTAGDRAPVQNVTGADGGAKRDSFFKKRDYE
ncbi:MAG TPA: hypothetical protein VM733_00060 [Thermoanaerobaculia bacterium]|nr:hypothetical protein [Thermoanaerobaculia bacterium]